MPFIKPRKSLIYLLLGAIALGLSLVIQGGSPHVQQISLSDLSTVSETAWSSLAHPRIWFGHQSVGGNIVEGLKEVRQTHPQIKVNIVETTDPTLVKTAGLIHFAIGQNAHPETKIAEFATQLQRDPTHPPDVAFFKFCFLDIDTKTNVAQVFKDYKTVMDQLIQTFPKTKFVQVTVPLTIEPTGTGKIMRNLKYGVRKILQQPVERSFENMNRSAFNELLRQTYADQSTVFDLAKFESIGPNGQQKIFSAEGKPYLALVSAYTDDGAHLNSVGRKAVAEQLLIFLTKLLK